MSRVGMWIRWSWRDLRERWLLVAAIAAVIAIGTGLAAGLGSIESWRIQSLDKSSELLDAHDLRVSLTGGSFAEQGRLRAVAESIPHASAIAAADERLVAESQIDASKPGDTVLTPGRLVGVDVAGGGPVVDRLFAESGRILRASDSGEPDALLEVTYADAHGIDAGREIEIAGGKSLRVVGLGSTPDTWVIIPPGQAFSLPGSYGVVYVPLETAQRLLGRPSAVNELVLTLTGGTDPALVQAELERQFDRELPQLGATVTPAADESLRTAYNDAGNDQQLMNVLALFVLVGAALAAFNLVGRVIEAQRRQIGIGMALGAPRARLALRPLLLAVEVALLGVLFGIVAGILVGWAYGFALRELFPLPITETPIQPAIFARGAAIGFLLPFAAAAYPVWRGIRMKPIEAIEIGFRAGKGSGLAPLLKRLPLPGRTFWEMPIRDTLRTPRRTLMTVIGLASVVAVVVSFFGMLDSFNGIIDRTARETSRGNPARMNIELDRFYPRSSSVVKTIESSPAVGPSEPKLRVAAKLIPAGSSTAAAASAADDDVSILLDLIDPASPLWTPSISKGSFEPGSTGIVLAQKAADDLRVGVGDRITLRHPRRVGATAFESVDTTVRVAAIHPNPLRVLAYMDSSQAGLMGLAGATNVLSVAPAPGKTTDQVTRALFGEPGVASIDKASAATDAFQDYMDDFTGFIQVAGFIVALLALLIAFNSTSINAEERARENATMFAFGLPTRSVLAMAIAESLIKGVLATLLGIGLGLVLIGWVFYAFLPDVLPDIAGSISLSTATFTSAALVGIVASGLAPLLTLRRLRRMDIPSTLRVVE